MLGKIRQAANSIFVKAILVLIIASFVFWGVGDIFRGNYGNTIAKVGDINISHQEYQQSLARQKYEIENSLGEKLGEQDDIFIRRITLRKLINDGLFKQESENLGILVDDEVVLKEIIQDRRFADDEGNFSKKRFDLVMNMSNLLEEVYIANLKKLYAQN